MVLQSCVLFLFFACNVCILFIENRSSTLVPGRKFDLVRTQGVNSKYC